MQDPDNTEAQNRRNRPNPGDPRQNSALRPASPSAPKPHRAQRIKATPYTGRRRRDIIRRVARMMADGATWRTIDQDPELPDSDTVQRWLGRASTRALLRRAHARRALELVAQGLSDLEQVDPDDKHGNARVAKAKALAEYRHRIAQALDRATWGEQVRVEAEVRSEIVATNFGSYLGLAGTRAVIDTKARPVEDDAGE